MCVTDMLKWTFDGITPRRPDTVISKDAIVGVNLGIRLIALSLQRAKTIIILSSFKYIFCLRVLYSVASDISFFKKYPPGSCQFFFFFFRKKSKALTLRAKLAKLP